MALGIDIKLFPVGRVVCVAYWSEGVWSPIRGKVEEVTKGRVHVRTYSGMLVNFSPNDRKLCFTYDECAIICKILSGREV